MPSTKVAGGLLRLLLRVIKFVKAEGVLGDFVGVVSNVLLVSLFSAIWVVCAMWRLQANLLFVE